MAEQYSSIAKVRIDGSYLIYYNLYRCNQTKNVVP